jgi:Flp pilus assembly protein TadG
MQLRSTLRLIQRDTSGAPAVEFAISSLVFLTILLGVAEIARYLGDRQDLMSAVHAADRYAVVHGSNSSAPATAASLRAMVASKLVLINAGAVTTTATFSPNNNPGSQVTITASYTWKPLVPMLHLPSATITATSTSTILN